MNDIVTKDEGTALATVEQVTPMAMIAEAVRRGIAPEQLDKLLALQERYEANEAKKAYASAFVAFKAEAQAIIKNKHVSFKTDRGMTAYDHATLAAVCEDVIPRLHKHGLAHRWKVESLPENRVRVRTILLHQLGHEEEVACFEGGADQSGGKNTIQGIGSTTAYFQRYGLLAGCGLATKDDDGRGAGKGNKTEVEPDPEGKKALEACGSLSSLQEAWRALTPEQRKTLDAVKESCKKQIREADKQP